MSIRNENTNIQNQKIKEIFFNNDDDNDDDIDVEIFINEKMKTIIAIDDNYNNDVSSLMVERANINDKYNNTDNNPYCYWNKEDHEVSSLLLLLLLLLSR